MKPLLRCMGSALVVVAIMTTLSFNEKTPAGAVKSSGARTLSSHITFSRANESGHTYAVSLFSKIPLPSGARRLAAPIKPLHPVTGSLGFAHAVDIARYYLVPSSIDVLGFAQSHFPKSEWQGNGSTFDGGYHTSGSFSTMSLCPDRHAAYCGVTYSALALSGDRQELRVDVAVVWMPLHVVLLPTIGVVTVTGYDKISLMDPSSGAVRVELNTSEVKKLRKAIALLRSSPGGHCMEDSALYIISVASASDGTVSWSASADECPGELVVTSNGSRIALNARSCPLDMLVATFFHAHQPQGTMSDLKVCQPSF
jgi:hypothetical protein